MKRVLLIAFHFPPFSGGSGILRPLKLCRYLPASGWLPIVLSANPRAYESVGTSQLKDIPENVRVIRAFALDTQRHLSIRGRYFRWMALPDRWASWCPVAVVRGLFAIYRYRVNVIYTTFPIATAVLIGLILHLLTGKPWIADFRDSMTEEAYPRHPLTRRIYRWIERQTVRRAFRLVFTARSTIEMYLKRYPDLPRKKCLLIPNGYDEGDFQELCLVASPSDNAGRPLRLVHMGLLYPEERDPRPFFQAVARLKREGRLEAANIQFEFRASGFDELYAPMLRDAQIEDLVHFLPALPYREALRDSALADGLLLFQAACCDHQIPAKVYEYMRLRKPVLALTNPGGDTAALLEEVGGAQIVNLAEAEAIHRDLPQFLAAVRSPHPPLPSPEQVIRFSREEQAKDLANVFSEAAASR